MRVHLYVGFKSASPSFVDHLQKFLYQMNLLLILLQILYQLVILVFVVDFSSYYLINICL